MATRTYHVDDLELASGKEVKADEPALTFMLDGTSYEIDLSAKNASKLRTILAPYAGAGRRSGSAKRTSSVPKPRTSSAPTTSRDDNDRIREWARSKGIEVAERGRIPNRVLDKYRDHRLRTAKEGSPSPAGETAKVSA
jgi:hypothetical protein